MSLLFCRYGATWATSYLFGRQWSMAHEGGWQYSYVVVMTWWPGGGSWVTSITSMTQDSSSLWFEDELTYYWGGRETSRACWCSKGSASSYGDTPLRLWGCLGLSFGFDKGDAQGCLGEIWGGGSRDGDGMWSGTQTSPLVHHDGSGHRRSDFGPWCRDWTSRWEGRAPTLDDRMYVPGKAPIIMMLPYFWDLFFLVMSQWMYNHFCTLIFFICLYEMVYFGDSYDVSYAYINLIYLCIWLRWILCSRFIYIDVYIYVMHVSLAFD